MNSFRLWAERSRTGVQSGIAVGREAMDSSLLLSVVCFKVAPGRKTEGKKHLPLGGQYVWVSQECTPLDLGQPHPGASPGGQEMVETSIPSQCDYARRKGAQSVSQ